MIAMKAVLAQVFWTHRVIKLVFPTKNKNIELHQWLAIVKPLCSPKKTNLNFRSGFEGSDEAMLLKARGG